MVSILVPVYNAEAYLSKCIESLLSQSFRDFELILINDGSSDLSGEICNNYALKDERIKVVHQKNQGVSIARNQGLDIANGEWITFVDSDDWVSPIYLQRMIDSVIDLEIDLVVSGLILEKKNSQKMLPNNDVFLITEAEHFHALYKSRLLLGPCQKLYKKKIIKEAQIKFDKDIYYGEDRLFNYDYLYRVRKIATVNSADYHYRIHESGSLSSLPYKNLFDLEYNQWLSVVNLYRHHDIFNQNAQEFFYKELYWMITDNILDSFQWSCRKSLKDKYQYIKQILCIPEIAEIYKLKNKLGSVSNIQFWAVTHKSSLFFLLLNYIQKETLK